MPFAMCEFQHFIRGRVGSGIFNFVMLSIVWLGRVKVPTLKKFPINTVAEHMYTIYKYRKNCFSISKEVTILTMGKARIRF